MPKASSGKRSSQDPRQRARPAASYRDAGVNLDVYAESMKRLPALMRSTFTPRVIPNEGGFAGYFSLDRGKGWMPRNYRDPVLVSGTDGVGTKLHLARMLNRHDTVGIDLVGMCVNDVICSGAEPMFFLDYVAMSHDDPDRLEQIVAGVSEGCRQAGSALLGGETAIMPGTYQHGDYDLAGFQVGVVERSQIISGQSISAGDSVIGLASSGVHSNGYSLVRRIVIDIARIDLRTHVDALGGEVGDVLLTPTRIYARALREVMSVAALRKSINGVAHITGGGIQENVERIMPSDVDLVLDGKAWPIPPVFPWLMEEGNVDAGEMYRVFNMGLGMVWVVRSRQANKVCDVLRDNGYPCQIIGEAVPGKGKVRIKRRQTR
jgi:phosphoribosylformylglycinamidine cyclo-ligase